MKLKLKEHTLLEVLNDLTNLYEHGAKKLCVICNDKDSLDGVTDPLIDGENVTRVKCTFREHNKKLIPVLEFEFKFESNCKAMKLVDVIHYIEKLPIKRTSHVALLLEGDGLNYEYDSKVFDDDNIWNVIVK